MSRQDNFYGVVVRIHNVKLKNNSDLQTYSTLLCELLSYLQTPRAWSPLVAVGQPHKKCHGRKALALGLLKADTCGGSWAQQRPTLTLPCLSFRAGLSSNRRLWGSLTVVSLKHGIPLRTYLARTRGTDAPAKAPCLVTLDTLFPAQRPIGMVTLVSASWPSAWVSIEPLSPEIGLCLIACCW